MDTNGGVKWSEFQPMAGELIKTHYANSDWTGEPGTEWREMSDCTGHNYRINQQTGDTEWMAAASKPMGPMLRHMWQLFKQHDVNGSGELEWDEFWTVMTELGLEMSEEEMEQWHAFADKDTNGSIKWSEFEPMADELIAKYYTTHEYTGGEDPWVTMTDSEGNRYSLNKKTGECVEMPVEAAAE